MSATTTPGTGAAESLAKRVEQLRAELAAQRKRTNFAAGATLVLGLVILAVLGGYFYYGYTQFTEVTRPQKIVDAGNTYLSDQIPGIRKTAEEYLVKSAPEWAEMLSQRAQEAVPQAREQLENYVLTQFDATLDKGMLLTDEQFKTFLKNNKTTIETGLKEMASNPQMAESTINDLVAAIESQMKGDIAAQTEELFTSLKALNAEIKKLRDGTNLTPEEQQKRRLVMLFHRSMLDHAQGTGGSQAETAAAVPAAESAPAPPVQPAAAEPIGNIGRTKGRPKKVD
jgi:uncharacterized membrane protein YukC